MKNFVGHMFKYAVFDIKPTYWPKSLNFHPGGNGVRPLTGGMPLALLRFAPAFIYLFIYLFITPHAIRTQASNKNR